MKTRALTPVDFEPLQDLMLARESFLGVHEQSLDILKQTAVETARDLLFVGPQVGTVFGTFDDQDALVAAVFTSVSAAHPCYYVNKAYTSPGASLASLSEAFSSVIAHYESLGYSRFYTLYRERDIDLYQRLWRTARSLDGYMSYTDLSIPANTRPKQSEIWEMMMGRILYVTPMVVRGFIRVSETTFFHGFTVTK